MKEFSDELVISFLFPPSDNVSGITVSKRIIENSKTVDILQAKFDKSDDNEFNRVMGEYVNNRILVNVKCDNDWWECITEFVKKGLLSIKNDYAKIYSRSWLMANHFLAAEYKFKNNSTFWTAEFSDPLIYDISNNEKTYKQMIVDDNGYIDKLNNQINGLNMDLPLIEYDSSAYLIAEYLVYLFADKIIFTNENQREIMLRQFPFDVYDLVYSKSEIKAHPTLSDEFYHIKDSKLKLKNDYINLAYFGSDYYGKRNFESLFYALESLNHEYKDKIRLYIFINDKKLIKRLASSLTVKNNIKIKKPLEYLEFLNATTKFDVLIVNDLLTHDNFDVNPYLPSKLSDYLGSQSDIWAISEPGSSLSKYDVKYKSDINDFTSSGRQLVKILKDHGYEDENYSFDKDYFVKRLTLLNELYEKEFRKNQKLKQKSRKIFGVFK